jgi:hypothetical protein
MRPKLLFFIIVIILLSVVGINAAQENTCEIQESDLATIVSTVCSAVGENEVCYGNLLVNLVPQAAAPDLNFNTPGDMAGLNNVRSLFLSALNESNDTWGIAQMRLLAVTSHGAQEVLLLLFGDVRVDNEVDSSVVIPVKGEISTNVRSAPFPQSVVMGSIQARETVEAIGRLADTSWIRVRMPETNLLGWVLADLLIPVSGESLDTLAVQSNNEPYFGAMQAISLTTGNSGSCGNFETDGLLIQTPAGTARVTLLINEVTIELIPAGALGVTAFIQSNPENGMDINVIDGSTFVSVDGNGYYVSAGSSTNVSLDATSSPTAPPTFPTTFEADVLDTVILLGTVRDPDAPITDVYTIESDGETSSDTAVEIVEGTTGATGTNAGTDTAMDSTCTKRGNACNAPGQNRGSNNNGGSNSTSGGNGNGNGNGG